MGKQFKYFKDREEQIYRERPEHSVLMQDIFPGFSKERYSFNLVSPTPKTSLDRYLQLLKDNQLHPRKISTQGEEEYKRANNFSPIKVTLEQEMRFFYFTCSPYFKEVNKDTKDVVLKDIKFSDRPFLIPYEDGGVEYLQGILFLRKENKMLYRCGLQIPPIRSILMYEHPVGDKWVLSLSKFFSNNS